MGGEKEALLFVYPAKMTPPPPSTTLPRQKRVFFQAKLAPLLPPDLFFRKFLLLVLSFPSGRPSRTGYGGKKKGRRGSWQKKKKSALEKEEEEGFAARGKEKAGKEEERRELSLRGEGGVLTRLKQVQRRGEKERKLHTEKKEEERKMSVSGGGATNPPL